MYLLPTAKPWLVWFGDDPIFDFDIYVDVGTMPVREPGLVSIVDLDLDVIRKKTGDVVVLDEDELIENSVLYRYPEGLVEHAERTAVEVVALLRAGVEPFDQVCQRWKREAAAPKGGH